ncbi:taurine ABC transporter permease TauC [Brenneria tiliae]|uniref:Taurine ABC transporter permease TauC n=1 Tax=Brenneria tiliae TaxID=2914984 RepID=A0ABT0MYZ8_9GAMM|nr:taurine ABC transporter permease TauC [Brenneria tiliae]MCL2895086.1 taurine ABC transporter permease TauC [Brenneria tiliae]MCL2899357.1 taurine ABC transporter permease TauC [Brenneria tiliae]MCL2903735.1 taurine ABC transporter permease TauC [Brenneria tiliae]
MSALDNATTRQNNAGKPPKPSAKKPLPLIVISSFSVTGLLLTWWLVTRLNLIEPLFLPSPGAVLRRLWQLVTVGYMDSTLWHHLYASLQRIGLALLAALATAIPLGVAIGRSRIARGIFDPLIEFYRPIPPLAYLPLIVIWFGIGEFSKVLLIYLAILAPVVIATAGGVRSADPARVSAAQTLGATPWQLIRYVIFPGALPDILIGIRIGLGVGWSTLVAAELVAATQGLGFMVQAASQFLVTDVVILGILVIAIVAVVMEIGLRYLQRKLAPWHGQTS